MVKDTRLYNRLEVNPSATSAEIKRAFRKTALKFHPDKNVDNPSHRDAKFIEAYQAYEILSDQKKRRLYDTQGPEGVFGRGSGVPTEPNPKPAYRPHPTSRARPSPGRTPNYGGTSFNYRSYARDSNDDGGDGDPDFNEEELRRIIEELLKKRYNRVGRQGGLDGSPPLFSEEDIDDMLRPSLCAFILWSLLDIAMNVSAGAAAAAAGGHANGSIVTHRVTSLGALAGLTKSGIVTFAGLTKYLHFPPILDFPFQLLGSGLVVCLLVTLQVSGMAMGQKPGALCGAAIIAGIPLWFESMDHAAASRTYPLWLVHCFKPCICNFPIFIIFWPIYLIAFDAFGGFVFALAAKVFGMPICAFHAAAAAGAVYGTLTGATRRIIGCCGCMCACCCVLSQLAEDV